MRIIQFILEEKNKDRKLQEGMKLKTFAYSNSKMFMTSTHCVHDIHDIGTQHS